MHIILNKKQVIIMGFKDQLYKIKDNWLIVAAIVIFLLFTNLGGVTNRAFLSMDQSMGMSESIRYSPSYDRDDGDFAPEVEERKIIKTTHMTNEVDEFHPAEQNFKNMITSSGSFILNENVNKYGSDRKEYFRGSYQIKVDTKKYDSFIAQLKTLGEVQSFSENERDITGQYTNSEINLAVEKARLVRYQELYDKAGVSDQLEVIDRIYNQERMIKYLEDSIDNLDERIEYSTVYFTLNEKQSDYANVVFVKFSTLIKNFVNSVNALFGFVFTIIPWAIAAFALWLIYRFFKKPVVMT